MTTEVEKLIVSLEASTKKYEQALAKAQGTTVTRLRSMEKEAQAFSKRFDQKLGSIGAGLKSFGAGFIGGLGIEALSRAALSAVKSIADIGDQAKKLALTTGEFQTLKLAAQLSGVEVEALAGGMKKLGINSSEAIRGQGAFGEILKANGISLLDTNGKLKGQIEILGVVADLVKNAANEQDGLAIAQAALGKSGTELMNLLAGGAGAVEDAMRQAKEAGVAFTEEQIAAAQKLDDQFDVLIEKISIGLKSAFLSAAEGGAVLASALQGIANDAANAMSFTQKVMQGQNGNGANVVDDGQGGFTYGGNDQSFTITPPAAASAGGKVNLPARKVTAMPPDPAIAAEAKRQAQEATRAANARAKAIADVVTQLKFESSQLGVTGLQLQINTELHKAGVTATSAQGKQIAALVTEQYKYGEALDYTNKAASFAQKQMEEMQAANADLLASQMGLASMALDGLEQIATGGAKAADVMKNLASQILQTVIQASLLGQGPLASILGSKASGGAFGQLFSMFNSGGGSAMASFYHQGGTVGAGGRKGSVNPAAFDNAPRYHSGGVAGLKSGEVPAILQKGEVVIPRGGKMGGGANVQIIDQRRNAPAIEQRRDGQGNLTMLIRDAVNDVIGSGGADKAMRSKFGLTPGKVTR